MQAIHASLVATTAISFELEPPTVAEMARRVESTLERFPWLVGEDADGRGDGYVHASRRRERAAYQWAVGATAYVRGDARGRSVGKRLC